jgi:hypothetical protein
VAVLFWLGALWRFMRKAEGAGPMLATSAVAGGVLTAALTAVGGIMLGAVAILRLQNGIAPSGVRFFYVLGNNLVLAGGFGVIVLLASVSFLVLRSDLMPRWVAALGGVDIVLWIVACGAVTSTKDFIFYFGFAALTVFAIWVLVVSILMLRAPSGGESGAPAVAETSAA